MEKRSYWDKRKDWVYLHVVRIICARFAQHPKSVLDVGSNRTPTLEWHRDSATRLVSLDLYRPYVADGVVSVAEDFLQYRPGETFDLVTCLQVLEHVPDAYAFAQRLLATGRVVVVSVPYRWPKGRCKGHVHDPVDRLKMYRWFRRWPTYSYIAREVFTRRSRLIQVYRPEVSFGREIEESARDLLDRVRREAHRIYGQRASR